MHTRVLLYESGVHGVYIAEACFRDDYIKVGYEGVYVLWTCFPDTKKGIGDCDIY